jgi:hypothetical protein
VAHDQILKGFRNSVTAALAKFRETAEMGHAGLKGRFREIFVKDLLRPVLSNEFLAGSGVVVDHTGLTSREADVIIFDKFHIPAVLYNAEEGLFPIEGTSYYGEVKSKLTTQELHDAVEKFRVVRKFSALPNHQGISVIPPRFLFAWTSDLKGEGIEKELERYIKIDELALVDPAATIICVVGKGYCSAIRTADGKTAWYKIGNADGVQEVVNFIGGVANSLIDLRMQKFGVRFGHYIIPDGVPQKLFEVG